MIFELWYKFLSNIYKQKLDYGKILEELSAAVLWLLDQVVRTWRDWKVH